MKLSIATAVLSILFSAFACSSQQGIPNRADRIEITTIYPDSALYESALTYLDQEEFVIDKADPRRGTILTDYKSFGSLVAVRLILSIRDSRILIRGEGDAQVGGYRVRNQQLINRRAGSRVQYQGFLILDDEARRLCRRLPKSTYTYGFSRKRSVAYRY